MALSSFAKVAEFQERAAIKEINLVKTQVQALVKDQMKAELQALQEVLESLKQTLSKQDESLCLSGQTKFCEKMSDDFGQMAEKIFNRNGLGFENRYSAGYSRAIEQIFQIAMRRTGTSLADDSEVVQKVQSGALFLASKASSRKAGTTAFTITTIALYHSSAKVKFQSKI